MSDSDQGKPDTATVINLTAQIVSAYAGKASLSAAQLIEVIGTVSRAITAAGSAPTAEKVEELIPAVPIKKSVSADFIVCLEDGKKLKMLKRHLMGVYGLTPAAYREKWSLPRDYPMVATNYAAIRSQLAKKIGLGKNPAPAKPAPSKTGAKRGRPRNIAAAVAW